MDDWTGKGAVYAVGAGRITEIINPDAGWEHGSFTLLKLDHPPTKDRTYVYYAEGIRPSVRVGQHVRAGQRIGMATGASSGIEIGWASGQGGTTLAHARGDQAKGDDPGASPSPEGQDFLSFISPKKKKKPRPGLPGGGGVVHAMATGGIAVDEHVTRIAEKVPEAVIPLDERGQRFMAGMYSAVARSVVLQLLAGNRGLPGRLESGSVTYQQDYRTQYSGPITVQAADPRQFERQMAARARLAKLTAPAHH